MIHQPPIVLFDDDRGRFGPLTALRAVFELRTGRDTILQRHRDHFDSRLAGVWVPPRLATLVAERAPCPVNALPTADCVTLLNGRMLLPDEIELPPPGSALVVTESDRPTVVAATLTIEQAERLLSRAGESPADDAPGAWSGAWPGAWPGAWSGAELAELKTEAWSGTLPTRPWHLLDRIDDCIRHDLHARRYSTAVDPPAGTTLLRGEPIVIDATARLCPGVTIDSEHGPVLVGEGALVRPGAVLCGPCVVGANSVVAEQAVIRARTIIGPRCKVGGEISGCIFLGCANKVHDGFLGDSIVGEWVNLGAGTVGSNLLNTYGETTMRLEPDGPRERTGRAFLGAVIGDHVKTAIGTRLMTATAIGMGAMIAVATPPPTTVPAFAWMTDDGTRTYRLDRFLDTMTRVMARRNETPSAALIAAVTALHATAAEPV